MAKHCKENDFAPLPPEPEGRTRAEISRLRSNAGPERPADLRNAMQSVMMDQCGVFRTADGRKSALPKIAQLRERYKKLGISDKSQVFNTNLLEAMELGNLLDLSEVTVESALARQESRGAHYREDFPKRDDQNWLKHTLAWREEKGVKLGFKPVVVTKFQPKERKY